MATKSNNTFRYDLQVGQDKENELSAILADAKLEVKSDQFKNGRHAIEIKKVVNGVVEKSGLSATESEWYVLAKSNSFLLLKTAELKFIINELYHEIYEQGKVDKDTGLLIVKGVLYMMGQGYRSYCMLVEEEELVRRLARIRAKGVGDVC